MLPVGLINTLLFLNLEFYTLTGCYQKLKNQNIFLNNKKIHEIYTENDDFCHYHLNCVLIAKTIKIYQQNTVPVSILQVL